MQSSWTQIHSYIKRRIEKTFTPFAYSFSIDNGIALLTDLIEYRTGDSNLDGLTIKLKDPLFEIIEGTTRAKRLNNLKLLSTSLEAFLRKILLLIDPISYSELRDNRKGFHKFIDKLINPLSLKFYDYNPSMLAERGYCAEDICRVYPLRNVEAHENPEWDEVEMEMLIKSVLTVYAYSVFEHFEALKSIIYPERDYGAYIKSLKERFRFWNEKFVSTDLLEEENESLNSIELDLIEINWDSEEDDEEVSNERFNYFERRKGKLFEFLDSEKRLVVIGSPGMGKTTTLQHLTFQLASETKKIPVFVELKQYTENLNLDEVLSSMLNLSPSEFQLELNSPKFVFLLDGLNEVINIASRIKLHKQIEQLLNGSGNFQLIISTRKNGYDNNFNLPIFQLQLLSDIQLKEFVDKNYQGDGNSFYTVLLKNQKLYSWSRNPLMLKMLISVVQKTGGQIPENSGKLLKAFINGIFQREAKKNLTFNKEEAKALLSYLAYKTRIDNQVGFTRNIALHYLQEKASELNIATNLISFISNCTDLNILTANDDNLSFSHELYQEYLCADYLAYLYEINSQNVLIHINSIDWSEPIIMLKGIYEGSGNLFSDILSQNVLLAAKTISSNIQTNISEENELVFSVYNITKYSGNSVAYREAILALIEIGKIEIAIDILHNDTLLEKKQLRKIFNELIEKNISDIKILSIILSSIVVKSNQMLEAWFWKLLFNGVYYDEFIEFLKFESNYNRCINYLFTLGSQKKIVSLFFKKEIFDLDTLDKDQFYKLASAVKKYALKEEKISLFNDYIKKHSIAIEPLYLNYQANCIIDAIWDYGIRIRIPENSRTVFLSNGDGYSSEIKKDMTVGSSYKINITSVMYDRVSVKIIEKLTE